MRLTEYCFSFARFLAFAGSLTSAAACSSGTPSSSSGLDGAAGGTSDAAGGAPTDAATDAISEAGSQGLWDWVGVVGTGQSLSVGAQGTPLLATTQPYHNLKLSLGTGAAWPLDPMSSTLSMVPLVEPIRSPAQTYPSAYPLNVYGETPHTAMANQITALVQQTSSGSDLVTVHTVVGESGQGITVINKAAMEMNSGATSMGRAYAGTLFEASAISRLATAAGKTYGIGAIVITHGETDTGNTGYEAALVQLWTDYNADLKARTGQTIGIPMLVSQQHSVPAGRGSTSAATIAQWHVGVSHEGSIVCSGPKYQYPYFTDAVHLTSRGYDLLGEKYGEVFFQKVVLGNDWQPVQPLSASRAGNVVTVQFHVPVPPLAWDDALPSPHPTGYPQWTSGRGFEVVAGGSPVTIDSVEISGDTVRISCATDVTAGTVTVSYAHTADGAAMPGGTARWGHLRDSDPIVGTTTQLPQPNYCVSFSMSVP
jgi:hypothetical protein